MRLNSKGKFFFLIALLFLLISPVCSVADGSSVLEDNNALQKDATNLTSYLRLDVSGHDKMRKKVLDATLDFAEQMYPYERFFAYWDSQMASPRYLCVQWDTPPVHVQLWQMDKSGTILSQNDVPTEYDTVEELLSETVRVAFVGSKEGMSIIRLALFSDGVLPEPFVNWQPTPDHLDYLIIATHPDDDVLFMGGIIPIYGSEQGYVGTVAYVTSPNRMRIDEARMGAWAMGTIYTPLFLDFQDVGAGEAYQSLYAYRFLPEAVTLEIVRLLRAYRPLVVFSHDEYGEYSHWQHRIVSASVVEACKLAADKSFDPFSVAEHGTWEVKKCYLHLYPQNTLVMEINVPLSSRGGKTALEIAQASFQRHKSQQTGRHWVQSDEDRHPMSHFGMVYGTVEAGDDVFDNINPALLYSAITAEADHVTKTGQ